MYTSGKSPGSRHIAGFTADGFAKPGSGGGCRLSIRVQKPLTRPQAIEESVDVFGHPRFHIDLLA